MPVLLLERLPLPSLQAYAVISISLLFWSLNYAAEKTLDTGWRSQFPEMVSNSTNAEDAPEPSLLQALLSQHWISARARDIFLFSIHDSLCIWTVVNIAYCGLVLLGNWVQKQVFGELRVSELQHIKDRFWNFVFYKFIFIFGIINVQSMEGVIMWGSWFSAIGFLHIHAQLCQDRFEYLSTTPCTPRNQHFRLFSLLMSILVLLGFLFIICVAVGRQAGWITFALVAPECLLLTLRTTHVIARYLLYLKSFHSMSLNQPSQGWSPVTYYVELAVEISCLILDLAHHIHMLLRANMLLSMASLVIFMQLRVLYAQLRSRLRRHGNYRRMLNIVQLSCPLEELKFESELELEDNKCAICWEPVATARRLPCGHHFHHGCLLRWLEQDPSCPTCRRQLLQNDGSSVEATSVSSRPRENAGWREWSWSSYSQLLQQNAETTLPASAENSQLESLAEQIVQMFPDYTLSAVIEDLRSTGSMDLTIENILNGQLEPSLPSFQQEPSNPSSSQEQGEVAVSASSREPIFVEDPVERQQLLNSRKVNLMEETRHRFLRKQALNNSECN